MKINFKPHPKPGAAPPRLKSLPKIKPPARTEDTLPRFKSRPGYIRRVFTLTHGSYSILQKCVQERHLGVNGYDEALQLILQEWKQMKDRQHHPVLMAVPADMLPRQDQPKGNE